MGTQCVKKWRPEVLTKLHSVCDEFGVRTCWQAHKLLMDIQNEDMIFFVRSESSTVMSYQNATQEAALMWACCFSERWDNEIQPIRLIWLIHPRVWRVIRCQNTLCQAITLINHLGEGQSFCLWTAKQKLLPVIHEGRLEKRLQVHQ